MTSSISHLRLRWNTTLSHKNQRKIKLNLILVFFINYPKVLGGSWSLIALSLWHYYFGRCVDWFPPTLTLCCGNTDCGDTHAAKPLQLDGDAWPPQLRVFFFFFRGWFLSVLFLNFLLKTRDPGFSIVWGWTLWFLDWVCLRNGGMGWLKWHGNYGITHCL